MGDIQTHYSVTHHVIQQLQAVDSDEEYSYLELGNFLTDVSQFRDPTAWIGAKPKIFLLVTAMAGGATGIDAYTKPPLVLLGAEDARGWTNRMLGEPEPPERRHGALPTFLGHAARYATHLKLSDGSRARYQDLAPLPASEIERVFAWAFTQYYPHEHLDFPPVANLWESKSRRFDRRPWGVLAYLDMHLMFVAEELSRIEHQWVLKRALPPSHPDRRDLLVRLGHVLHAVEDFFFHSNTVEVRQWLRVRSSHPTRDPRQSQADYRFLVDHILDGTRHAASEGGTRVRLKRRLARRLRYPTFREDRQYIWMQGPNSDPRTSDPATEFVYTGGFGGTDVFHTLGGGLAAFEESFKHNFPAFATELDKIPLPLVRALFSEEERRRLVDDAAYREEQIQKHKEELVSGKWELSVALMQAGGLATPAGADALRAAFRLDLEVENAWGEPPGIGGFMLRFLALVQSELDASHGQSAALDADPESPYAIGGANGASEEFVGTHTLMSKDGEEKEPLRREALALAKFASAGLATRLLERVRDDPDPNRGLDWYRLLRHFLRYPPPGLAGWENEVLVAIGPSGEGPVPAPNAVADQPSVLMLTGSRLAKLREGEGRVFLERSYRALERSTK